MKNERSLRVYFWRLLPVMGVVLVLASCGGSDDGTPPLATPVNQPPASASASTDGFIAFLKTVVVTMPETTEPLDVATFVAPVADLAQPDPSI